MARDVKNPGIFAADAITTIPTDPVVGVPYRDPVNGLDNIRDGWPYKTIVNSPDFAQILHDLTALTGYIDRTGILEWKDDVEYDDVPAYVRGSDGELYVSLQVNGPSATVVDPVGDTTSTWRRLLPQTVEEYSINGRFDIWERGPTFSVSGYTSDRHQMFSSGGGSHTVTQESFAAGQTEVSENPKYFSRSVVVAGGAATDVKSLVERVFDVTRSSGQKAVLIFDARAGSGTPQIAVEGVQNFGIGGDTLVNSISVQKFTLSTSWQTFIAVLDYPSVAGKTIGSLSSFDYDIWFSGGTDAASRHDNLGLQSGTFDLANIRFISGDTPVLTPRRSEDEERTICERYFFRPDPGDNTNFTRFSEGAWIDVNQAAFTIYFPQTMITSPSFAFEGALSDYRISTGGTFANAIPTGVTEVESSKNSVSITVDYATGGQTSGVHSLFMANGPNTTNSLIFEAELM